MARSWGSNYSKSNSMIFGFKAAFPVTANMLHINIKTAWNNSNEFDYGEISL